MGDNRWEPCPSCGSNNVITFNILFYILTGLVVIRTGFFFTSTPFIGYTLIFIGGLILFVSPFMRLKRKCEDCNNTWWYPAEKGGIIKRIFNFLITFSKFIVWMLIILIIISVILRFLFNS